MGAYITAIGTAVPTNKYTQDEIADFMCNNIPLNNEEQKKLRVLYRATGIKERYSVLDDYSKQNGDFTFFKNTVDLQPSPPTSQRMRLYRAQAKKLALAAVSDCLKDKPVMSSFTHLITVSCTGMYAPGLDVDLIKALNLQPDINRTSINFMGCYAAMNALALAKQICDGQPHAKILLVSVELCTIHLQQNKTEDNLLAHSLFSDGAAAAVISTKPTKQALEITSSASHLSFNGQNEMAWQIGDFGFEMSLSSYVPNIIKQGIKDLTTKLLNQAAINLSSVDHYAIHPGGKKILETIESELGLKKEDNECAYGVLKKYGNMSSPTILFVLNETLKKVKSGENILAFAFGPGLTLESLLLKAV
ncbi:MAG: type III polyketide synthase [Reichenbachiella sp.]